MSLSNKELLTHAENVVDALTDAYSAKNKQINKMIIGGLGNLALGMADLALNGLKASTPLLGLFQLFKANSQPLFKMVPEMELELSPQPRNQALPRPRPY
jgi:hypothetical protein